MHEIVPPQQTEAARLLRELLAAYNQSRELINLGAYKPGSNPTVDRAIQLWPGICAFLAQRPYESAAFEDSINELFALLQ